MSEQTIESTIGRVDLYALAALSPERYEHSRRVAVLAEDLCRRFSIDPAKGFLAGIAHDMCKSGKDRWLLDLATRDGLPITSIERKKPGLLHGRAAAMLLAEDFNVTDSSVLDAVRNHTFGSPDMDALGRIMFVADKIEPGRTGMDPAFRAEILGSDLDRMSVLVLEDNIRYLRERGKEIASMTEAMLKKLKGRGVGQ